MTTTFIALSSIILYLFIGLYFAWRLSKGRLATGGKAQWLSLGLVASLLHAWLLARLLFVDGGLNIGFFNAFSLVTWLIALLILVSAYTKPVENLSIALLPLAALGITLQLFFPTSHIIGAKTVSALEFHILISILAYSLFTIAAGQAILLSIQDRHLRTRHPGGFIRALPPLETMETLLFQMLGMGFVLQSLSLISGAIYLENMFAQHLAHKTVFSICAWLIYGILLYGRWRMGWRGKKAVRWTLTGFVSLLFAYLGSKLVLELILGR